VDKKHERKEGLTAVEIEQEKSASARSRAEVTSRWSPVVSTQQYLQGKALSLPYRSVKNQKIEIWAWFKIKSGGLNFNQAQLSNILPRPVFNFFKF